MDIKSLRYFNEVVQRRSLRRAGDALHITQPALSRYIKSLESELGIDLFVRNARGVAPTEAAYALAGGARELFDKLDQLTATVRALAAVPGGTLRVGALPAFGRHFAATVIGHMRQDYPLLRFQLVEAFSEKLKAMVIAGELDVAIIADLGTHPELERASLYREALWLVGCAAHWTPDAAVIEQEALRHCPLVVSRFVRAMVRDMLPLGELDCVLEIDGASVMPDLLRQNVGLYLGPPTMLWRELQSGEFAGAPVRGLTFARDAIWRRDRPQSAAAAMLLEGSRRALEVFAARSGSPVTLVPG